MRPDVEELLKQSFNFGWGYGHYAQEQGMMPGQCPELFGIENFECKRYSCQYIEAGADIIQTNTFGGNRLNWGIRLRKSGRGNNAEAVRKPGSAVDKVLVAAYRPSGNYTTYEMLILTSYMPL